MKWIEGKLKGNLISPCGRWSAWYMEPTRQWRVDTNLEHEKRTMANVPGYGATPDDALWAWVKWNRALGMALIEAAEDAEAALDHGVSMGPWRPLDKEDGR